MGVRRTFNEIAENLGAGTADLFDELAEASRNLTCDLYENHPGMLYGSNNPVGRFQRGFFDRVCSDRTPPPLPTPLFNGGQCPCETYDVTVQRPFPFGNPPSAPPITKRVFGRVKGLRHEFTPASPEDTQNVRSFIDYYVCENGVETGNTAPVDIGTSSGSVFPADYHDGWFISDIVILGGATDDCGDPPVTYPPEADDPNVLNQEISITLNDNSVVNYNLEFQTEPSRFPPNIEINGVKVVLDLGGINFIFGGGDSQNGGEQLPDGGKHPLPTPIDEVPPSSEAPTVPPPSEDDYEVDVKDVTEDKEEEVGIELEFVKVTLTSIPNNAKTQYGDGAPNVIYAGWFEFQVDGSSFPRQPIHFSDNIYKRPDGATGYAYTLYNGFNGFATVFKTKLEDN